MPAGDVIDPRALAEVLIRNHGPDAALFAAILIEETSAAGRGRTSALLCEVLAAIAEILNAPGEGKRTSLED